MKFNNEQLAFAREYRGFSQTELAKSIEGLAQSNLSKFEKGIDTLSEELLKRTTEFLNFPMEFFYEKIINKVESEHYRIRANTSKKITLDIKLSNRLIGFIIDQMTDSVEWPLFTLRTIDIQDGFTPEDIAKYTRVSLGLDDKEPVRMINHLLESNGIIIVEREAPEKFDGVSFYSDKGSPIIIINKNYSNDRKRFTIAHELGHLLMHSWNFAFPEDGRRDKEKEANSFASEFLMPAKAIRNSLRDVKLSSLAELKRYWLTSMAANIRRAKDLECISGDRYKYLNVELSRRGYKRNEPVNVFIDEPKLFLTAYRMHKEELDYSNEDLARAFHLPLDVIERFCSNTGRQGRLKLVL